MTKKTLTILLITILIYISNISVAQDEFMLYGKIGSSPKSDDIVTIIVKQKYKTIQTEKLPITGEYRLFFKYGEVYDIEILKDDFLPLRFIINLELPSEAKQCCYLPMELSCNLFKTSKYDSLFIDPLLEIKYDSKLQNYNYSIDINFLVEQMKRQSDENERLKIVNAVRQKEIDDSLRQERKYLNLINKGNLHFSRQEWAASKEYFLKAQEVLPYKKYPAYKLEDIKTEIELFAQKMDSLNIVIDTTYVEIIADVDTSKPKENIVKRKTPEELEAIFWNDVKRKMAESTPDTSEINKRMALIKDLSEKREREKQKQNEQIAKQKIETEKKEPVVIASQSTNPDKESSPDLNEADIDIVNSEEDTIPLIPNKDISNKESLHSNKIDYASYQDSLKVKYTKDKTIEIEEDVYKKTTRVILRNNDLVEVYLMVEHAWGATFYFKERLPLDYENITFAYFNYITNYKITENSNKEKIDSTTY